MVLSFFWVVLLLLFSFAPHRQGGVWLWAPRQYSPVKIYSPAIHRWGLLQHNLRPMCSLIFRWIIVLTFISVTQLTLWFPRVFLVLFANINFSSVCRLPWTLPFPFHMDPEWMSVSELGQNWIVDCCESLAVRRGVWTFPTRIFQWLPWTPVSLPALYILYSTRCHHCK